MLITDEQSNVSSPAPQPSFVAFEVTSRAFPGTISFHSALRASSARWATYSSAKDAGYVVEIGDFQVRRAAYLDAYAVAFPGQYIGGIDNGQRIGKICQRLDPSALSVQGEQQ